MASDRLKCCTSSSRIARDSRALARAGDWFPATSANRRRARRGGASGATGELLIRGDSTCALLLESPRKDQRDDRRALDSYRRSLPAGRGRLLLVCRSLRRHAESGRPVGQPAELEQTLVEHPDVSACGVAGCADRDGLIKPIAYVVVRDGWRRRRSWPRRCGNSRASGWPTTTAAVGGVRAGATDDLHGESATVQTSTACSPPARSAMNCDGREHGCGRTTTEGRDGAGKRCQRSAPRGSFSQLRTVVTRGPASGLRDALSQSLRPSRWMS